MQIEEECRSETLAVHMNAKCHTYKLMLPPAFPTQLGWELLASQVQKNMVVLGLQNSNQVFPTSAASYLSSIWRPKLSTLLNTSTRSTLIFSLLIYIFEAILTESKAPCLSSAKRLSAKEMASDIPNLVKRWLCNILVIAPFLTDLLYWLFQGGCMTHPQTITRELSKLRTLPFS